MPVIQARAHWPTLNGRMPTLRCACCQPNVAFFSSMCGLRLIEMNFDMCAGSMWRWRPTRDSRRGSHLETIRGTRHLGAINGTPEAPEAGQHPPRSGLRGSRKSRRKRYRSGQREAQETPDSLKEPWSVDLGAISGTPQISTLRFRACTFPHAKFTETAIS